jgi:hypothetical protein
MAAVPSPPAALARQLDRRCSVEFKQGRLGGGSGVACADTAAQAGECRNIMRIFAAPRGNKEAVCAGAIDTT